MYPDTDFQETIADVASFKKLIDLKTDENRLKAEYEAKKKERIALEETVYKRMENAGIQNINVDNTTLYCKTNIYASIPKDKKESGFQWLENNGYDSLIQTTVNSRTLSGVMKEFLAEGGEEPDCINVHIKHTIGMKGLQKAK